MKANPAEFELVAPRNLPAVLGLLAQEPGTWLPVAGGTDVMVQYSAGTLQARKLVSIWNLTELRRIEILPEEIRIGAGSTYTDLRQNECVAREFSMLASAASWTGGIANQNRGTLGGNIVNASPAGDSLPALLAYDAELLLVSTRGERRVPYAAFHTGYRKTQCALDELLLAVCLKRRFSGYYAHARKVGARNAQAIAKVCLAGLGWLEGGVIEDIRLAMGSVAPVPLRLSETERIVRKKPIDVQLLSLASATAVAEIRPIHDIRSTAHYRASVAGNLVAEFLLKLSANGARSRAINPALAKWNAMAFEKAEDEILPCCGSMAWVRAMAARRPILDEVGLLAASDEICKTLSESDWLEAFRGHPRIGTFPSTGSGPTRSAAWSAEEQRKAVDAADNVIAALAQGNRAYEERFRRIFIVCATGKSASEILEILQRRMKNDEVAEFREAAEQQRQITNLRLKKWLIS